MKNVILPTDLTVQSLWPIHQIVKEAKGQQLCIRLVHFIELPDSITGLIFSRSNKPYDAVPARFTEAYQMLQHKYKFRIEKIYFEFVYCETSRYLNNFLEGNKIDKVYLLSNYKYVQPLAQSVQFAPLFNKCKVPVCRVELDVEVSVYQSLSALLNSKQQSRFSTGTRVAETTVSYF